MIWPALRRPHHGQSFPYVSKANRHVLLLVGTEPDAALLDRAATIARAVDAAVDVLLPLSLDASAGRDAEETVEFSARGLRDRGIRADGQTEVFSSVTTGTLRQANLMHPTLIVVPGPGHMRRNDGALEIQRREFWRQSPAPVWFVAPGASKGGNVLGLVSASAQTAADDDADIAVAATARTIADDLLSEAHLLLCARGPSPLASALDDMPGLPVDCAEQHDVSQLVRLHEVARRSGIAPDRVHLRGGPAGAAAEAMLGPLGVGLMVCSARDGGRLDSLLGRECGTETGGLDCDLLVFGQAQ